MQSTAPRRDRWHGPLDALQTAMLSLWLGSLVMVSAIAAVAFPAMRDLAPTLPGYSGYPSGHWEIAAGHIMAPAFQIADGIQVACATCVGIALAILIATRRLRLTNPLSLFRLIIVVVLLGALIEYLMRVAEPMQTMLREFWAHAASGEVTLADSVRERFDALHPRSSMRLGAIMIGLILAIIASLLASARAQPTEHTT
ncbi:MAG: hypothetical protein ACF8GE_01105 [Phycisphaerales bacterium JB043]